MRRLSQEFLVGLLAIVAIVLAVAGVLLTNDRPEGVEGTYKLSAVFPSAEGVYATTPIRIAGVPVGAVSEVELDGASARVTLEIQGNVKLPMDSVVALASEGMLGDKFVRITPGKATLILSDGGVLGLDSGGSDLDALQKKAGLIADDIKVITGSIKDLTSDSGTQAQLRQTLENVEALSSELRAMASGNREDLDAIAKNLRDVSESLKRIVGTTGEGLDAEMDRIAKATESLDRTATHVESIVAKIDRGEGTVGGLINDSTTLDTVNATLQDVQATVSDVRGLVGGVAKLQTEVYYRGNYFVGSKPTVAGLDANPVAGGSRNVLGARLMPREDYWYVFEFVSHPMGTITYEDRSVPSLGTAYREYVVRPDYRFSFQIAKRFSDIVFRIGMKESSGGVGVDGMLFRDRLVLSADIFDFTYGSYPVMNGTPNVQVNVRAYPTSFLYVEGGLDNTVLGAQYGFVSGYVGGGFRFTDNDLKLILAAVPL